MDKINIWQIGNNVYIKPNESFLKKVNQDIKIKFKSKKKLYESMNLKNIQKLVYMI